jgi:hypothetical protein
LYALSLTEKTRGYNFGASHFVARHALTQSGPFAGIGAGKKFWKFYFFL